MKRVCYTKHSNWCSIQKENTIWPAEANPQMSCFLGGLLFSSCCMRTSISSGGLLVSSALSQAARITDAVSADKWLCVGQVSSCKELLVAGDKGGEVLSFIRTPLCPKSKRSRNWEHATMYFFMALMCIVPLCVLYLQWKWSQGRFQNGALENLVCRWEVPMQLPVLPSPVK